MNISIRQLCRIMEKEGLPIVERYRLLFALKQYAYYEISDDEKVHLKQTNSLEESDEEQMFEEAEFLAKTGYVSRRIKLGQLMEPDSLWNI